MSAEVGVVTEDAVFAAGVEAEAVQPALEVGDVVAAQHGAAPVEQPVTEAVAALDHRGPRLGPAHAVDPQAPRLLEGAHDLLGRRSVLAELVAWGLVAQRAEPELEVADCLAAAARPQHGRFAQAMNSARSCSS